ncbi:MAG: 4-phosphoerythronate dehydrogenase [Moraxellaceae bacterium]|nr:4-phosphoerythronate dehydrogenase [Moraxellaceae bacterium]
MNTLTKITIIADSNIAELDNYFNSEILTTEINLIRMVGREITADIINHHQADALLVRSVTQVNHNLLADNKSVKFVGSATIGTDHIDETYLQKKNIFFTNAIGCSKNSVAQYVITAILQLNKVQKKSTIVDKTLGIIGLGNIGTCLVNYADDLGLKILAYDPFLTKEQMITKNSKIQPVNFQQLLTQSDIISLHVPLTKSSQSDFPTYHLIDKQALNLMKSGCLLINSARGQVIKEADLLADMAQTGRQVVLDVFEFEPEIRAELLTKITIATPHIAGYTLEGKLRGTEIIYQAFCHYFNLPIKQTMINLLPKNPFYWQDLLTDLSSENLVKFYDIIYDDKQLRAKLMNNQIAGKDFDNLRKNYPLRREWQN